MGGSPTCRFIDGLDDWILHIFLAECVVKIFAEGLALSQYFCGKEWAWNNFDFIIVAVCLYGYDAGLLRLVRLMRVAKIVRKIPQLQVIVMGLLGGIKSIVYIVILLVIVFYIYGIAGVYAFRDNDPWHFGTLPTAMLTLFRCSTLEDWTDTMYINIYGCHRYPGGIYSQPRDLPVSYGPADASIESLSAFFDSRETALDGNYQCEGFEGKFVTWLASGTTTKHCTSKKAGLDAVTSEVSKWFCLNPTPNPYVSVLFFITFVVVSALVMLSLFVGAVTMSMTSSMNQMKEDSDKASRSKRLKRGSKRFSSLVRSNADELVEGVGADNQRLSVREKLEATRQRRIKAMLEDALNGRDLSGYSLFNTDAEVQMMEGFEDDTLLQKIEKGYSQLAAMCEKISMHPDFGNAITCVIIVAGVMVGLQTDRKIRRYAGRAFAVLDSIILGIFCLELLLKGVAEEFRPLNYFDSNWNKFDFVVVAGSLVSSFSDGGVPTGLLTMLRLLRLLRVLKLVKSLPQLQVIVTALIMGLNSIGYIAIILFMFFYMFGILGMFLFEDNDPWHFGTLHITLISLFRCSTLEDWTDVMYINIYGCDMYGYQNSLVPGVGVSCETPTRQEFTVLYFLVFQVVGALVLLTLFIGVVTTAMEEATQDQKKVMTVEKRVKAVMEEMKLSQQLVDLYREVFAVLDLDSGGRIEPDELYTGLRLVGTDVPKELLYELFDEVDQDRGGEIDFSEFITFMFLLQKARVAI
jgi:voltage-gated sodium channel